MTELLSQINQAISKLDATTFYGRVTKIVGMLVEITGVNQYLAVGSRCQLVGTRGDSVMGEIVGFRDDVALVLPFGSLTGIGAGARAYVAEDQAVIHPDSRWLGRVINALGDPIDGKGSLPIGAHTMPLRNKPPPAHQRQRVGRKLDLGVRAINSFLSTCLGQRMGIFAGSGVGKSVLLSMMARYTEADITVIGLVGERGREVQEFLQDDLGEEGLKRSVVIVATSDESPLMRRQAAYMTLSVAEHFRDQGKNVLCLMDSVTRFAMAQREIGLSVGEPPTSKGYPPTTFNELAQLLERAGPGVQGAGNITALFSVLVEGDDTNEPIADATRGILDGHIVMSRKIAERNRYPAIDILKSVSRMVPECLSPDERVLVNEARALISTYEDMAELIRLGAYRKGTDPNVDRAIALYPKLEAFLNQQKNDHTDMATGYALLAGILNG